MNFCDAKILLLSNCFNDFYFCQGYYAILTLYLVVEYSVVA